MVRVIRMFRPLVIHSRFAGNETDGHGQHQFAGYLTPLAFKAAAGSGAVSRADRRRASPVAGRGSSIARVAAARTTPSRPGADRHPRSGDRSLLRRDRGRGRSQHKSQEMGGIEPLGPQRRGCT